MEENGNQEFRTAVSASQQENSTGSLPSLCTGPRQGQLQIQAAMGTMLQEQGQVWQESAVLQMDGSENLSTRPIEEQPPPLQIKKSVGNLKPTENMQNR